LAGIDEEYRKPADKKTWGQLLLDFVGHPGVSKYDDYPSLPTGNDPLRVRDFLINEAGFDYVHVLTDEKATKDRIEELMVDILPGMIHDNDQFLFYWSGHGTQRPNAIGGQVGYLPLASSPKGSYASMISMGDIQRWDEVLGAKQALFLLDACFSGLAGVAGKSDRRELQIEQLDKPAHHLVSAGTAAEETIAGDRWGGSIFTDAVLRAARGEADAETSYAKDGVVSLSELIGYIKTRVAIEAPAAGWTTPITPQPYNLRSNTGEFFFLADERKLAKLQSAGAQYQGRFENGMPVVAKGTAPSRTCDHDADRDFWASIKIETAPGYFEAYLKRVESGELCGLFADIARLRLAALESARQKPNQPSPMEPATAPHEYQPGEEFRDCGDCPLMVVVPAGSSMMGSTEAEREWVVKQGGRQERVDEEMPQHPVEIRRPFAVGKYEVTFDEWDACVRGGGCNGYKPDRGWGRGRRPVINVSWNDAKTYVDWLKRATSQPYRLLSEAEWEYAARAGTTSRFWWGNEITLANANYQNLLNRSTEVGRYPPNRWGLHDTAGNLREWVEDCYHDSYKEAGRPDDGSAWTTGDCTLRTRRGGSWFDLYPFTLRSSARGFGEPNERVFRNDEGFRVARTLSP
jgi:formylglycine-generating enzyme required for sulfatase activity